MERYVGFIGRHRRPLLALFAVVTLVAAAGLPQIDIDPGFDVFRLEDSAYRETLDEMERLFGTSDQIMVVVDTGSAGLTLEIVARLRRVQASMETTAGVAHVTGPAPRTVETDAWRVDLTGSLTAADLDHLREHYEGMGTLSPLVETDDGLSALYSIYPSGDFDAASLSALEASLREARVDYSITGDFYLQAKVIDYVRRVLRFLPFTALALVLLVFRTQMRSLKATLLSILPAGVAALWTMGTVGWLGRPVSIITVLAPIFTVVIGSADGLHFVSHVQDAREEGASGEASIAHTLRMVGIPMVITTVTSMAGFLSLLVMNTAAIADLALFTSLGILFAGVASWYALPLLLAGRLELAGRRTRPRVPGRPSGEDRRVAGGSPDNLVERFWGVPSLVATAVIVAIAAMGMQMVGTDFNQLSFFRPTTDVRRSFNRIAEATGGTVPVYVVGRTSGDPLDPACAREVLDLEARLRDSELVGRTVSPYDALALINAGITGAAHPVYPATAEEAGSLVNLVAGEQDPTAHLLRRADGAVRVLVFPAELSNEALDAISTIVADADRPGDGLDLRVTGAQYLMRELNAEMTANQARTMGLAFAIIFVLLLVSLRNVRAAAISIVPIALTMLALFGAMGYGGISLNLFTATIFSIAMGVGIDYAVHFTSVWMSFVRRGSTRAAAARQAASYTARPIVANAFGLAIGLSALLLSPLQIHVTMSVLMWVAMVVGVVLSLSFLPTVLRGSTAGTRSSAR